MSRSYPLLGLVGPAHKGPDLTTFSRMIAHVARTAESTTWARSSGGTTGHSRSLSCAPPQSARRENARRVLSGCSTASLDFRLTFEKLPY